MSDSDEKEGVPSETSRSDTNDTNPSEEGNSSDTLASENANIEYPGQHDVKLGRGGDANSHIGNIKFRQLIHQYKPRYTAASRSNKPFVAEEVVQLWRGLEPSGRFLIRTDPSLGDDSTWHDVGNKRARKKASQALREKDRAEDFAIMAASAQGHGQGVGGGVSATHHLVGVAGVPGTLGGHLGGGHHHAGSLGGSLGGGHHHHHHHHTAHGHHGHAGHTARIPGMVATTTMSASTPTFSALSHSSSSLSGSAAAAGNGNGTPQAHLAAAVAALAAANEQRRKRARAPEPPQSGFPERRVAQRTVTDISSLTGGASLSSATPSSNTQQQPQMDHQAAARALAQLLQPSPNAGVAATAATPGANDALLLPMLQMLVRQKQQQELAAQQAAEQLQRQQTVSALTAAIASLTGGGTSALPPGAAAALASLTGGTGAVAPAAPLATSTTDTSSLDRMLASRILEGLMNGNGTAGAATSMAPPTRVASRSQSQLLQHSTSSNGPL